MEFQILIYRIVLFMQFHDTRQEIAKETSQGVPWNPLRPRCARRGSGGNIVYIKLCRGSNTTTHGFRLQNLEQLYISPIEFSVTFRRTTPNDFGIFCFIQNQSSRDFGRGIYFVFRK